MIFRVHFSSSSSSLHKCAYIKLRAVARTEMRKAFAFIKLALRLRKSNQLTKIKAKPLSEKFRLRLLPMIVYERINLMFRQRERTANNIKSASLELLS